MIEPRSGRCATGVAALFDPLADKAVEEWQIYFREIDRAHGGRSCAEVDLRTINRRRCREASALLYSTNSSELPNILILRHECLV